jgi:CRP/FNR family transcriptional regulator, cyclic AMP receptor protein
VVGGLGSPGAPAASEATGTFWDVISPEASRDLAARAVVRRFGRGRALFHEGQVPDRVLVLRSGRVKVTATTSNGREVVLAFRGPGDLVGEQSALDDHPRSATACAVEGVEALCVEVTAFRSFLAAHPDVALTLLRMLSLRLRDADAKRIELSTYTTIQRVAARLLELANRYGDDAGRGIRIALPLTQEDLAGATGSSIESVGRALKTLRALKCVSTARREIRVLDPAALTALRDAGG